MYKDLALIYESMGNKTYYHLSAGFNRDKILREGLTPSIGEFSKVMNEQESRIYLFGDEDDAENAASNWYGEDFMDLYGEDEPINLWEVILPSDWPLEHEAFEYTSKLAIPPTNIKLISENY
tara:strand:+ start:17563 stop:17928 length:366 start_codon:yes stop_codon:yes gene_type:complete